MIRACRVLAVSAVLAAGFGFFLPQSVFAQGAAAAEEITVIPARIDKGCRDGRARLYDECSGQLAVLAFAKKLAAMENKVLLVSYGAEWCIWCHVLDAHLKGATTQFTYTYGYPDDPEAYTATLFERAKRDVTAEAEALRSFVAREFVLVHIESRYAPNGAAVLGITGADAYKGSGIPFLFTVDRSGRYAARFYHDRADVRRDTEDWYRGYDRVKLLAELRRMRDAALKSK